MLAEFRALLERVRPTRTRPELTSVVSEPHSAYFILEVAHDQRDDFTVGLSLFEDDELMAYWGRLAHDDFFLPHYDTPEAGVNDAVGFIEQALTGPPRTGRPPATAVTGRSPRIRLPSPPVSTQAGQRAGPYSRRREERAPNGPNGCT